MISKAFNVRSFSAFNVRSFIFEHRKLLGDTVGVPALMSGGVLITAGVLTTWWFALMAFAQMLTTPSVTDVSLSTYLAVMSTAVAAVAGGYAIAMGGLSAATRIDNMTAPKPGP